MDVTPYWWLLGVVVFLLTLLIFRAPLTRFWNNQKADFDRAQSLERLAATNKHGHFYMTIEKFDREMDPVREAQAADGRVIFVWDGTEFNNREAADFARHTAVLAAARAYYGDIDTWTMSLPAPRPRRRRR